MIVLDPLLLHILFILYSLGSGVQPVFRQPRIHTGQYLDKYCMNQSESRKNINNPK